MTRGCTVVVDASAESFEGITIPHAEAWKDRDSAREYGLFHDSCETLYRAPSFGRTTAI